MSKEILYVAEALSNEKNVTKEVIYEAIELALASATRKKHRKDMDVKVIINPQTGNYRSFRRWEVVADEDLEFEDKQVALSEAQSDNPEVEIGDVLEEEMESIEFGRIAAQTAKQVILQKVREAERMQVVDKYEDRVGEVLNGTVKRVDRGHIFLDLGNKVEAIIPKDQSIPREMTRRGDRLRGLLIEVNKDNRGPLLTLSRSASEFLIELFKVEVPEIDQGLIKIKGAARDPGFRAKIAVHSTDPKLDPIGACVGMRGSRVMSVSNELGGERIDIVLWDEDPAHFVINAMAPAEIESIVVDEDRNSIDVAVAEDKLSQAIGRGGQNVRLASELTGWNINVMTSEQADEKNQSEAMEFVEKFMDQLDIDEDMAVILVQEGFSSIDEIAYVDKSELLAVEGFDEDVVSELRQRARDALLTQLISKEEKLEETKPADDLLNLEGMDSKLAYTLASKQITTRDDLADLSTDELMEISELSEEQASQLIVEARKHWFEEEE
ncbi:MAG TPA: transcription termination factor NusA [Gammaproteobacteria bacterium]|jgi:N utilization substance protein A|nr:transcription termination/antitermination protein NusA [Xanthomonadales bacterium]MCB1605108.1 transcription termination/antitermination protein NusA [Xanthomonadales bacterium]HOP21898.1 transcription termination factor NusA [Gammaproteobacteria bacterium]HPI96260.1 transcription termination factor NusA [Gammaproteobacteria bacterium]HPQ87144.1 transcription termination factor NusA [Gammaproteobacteria bacterium]